MNIKRLQAALDDFKEVPDDLVDMGIFMDKHGCGCFVGHHAVKNNCLYVYGPSGITNTETGQEWISGISDYFDIKPRIVDDLFFPKDDEFKLGKEAKEQTIKKVEKLLENHKE